MLQIGEKLENFSATLVDCFTGEAVQVSNYTNKTIIISFIDINNGWDWLKQFVLLQQNTAFDSNTQFISFIFDSAGALDTTVVYNKIVAEVTADPHYYNDYDWADSTDNFVIVADQEGGTTGIYDRNASIYLSYLFQDIVSGFSTKVLSNKKVWSYIATYAPSTATTSICNKWHNDCNVTPADPLSFRQMPLTGPGAFNPAVYTNMREYVSQRLLFVNAHPAIYATDPADSNLLNSVGTVKVTFSKLINKTAAETESFYSLTGAGSASLTVNDASFTGFDRTENIATLTFGGTPSDGLFAITLNVAITDTAGNSMDATARTIHYTFDLPPRITGVKINSR
jgi:hypothetical protein